MAQKKYKPKKTKSKWRILRRLLLLAALVIVVIWIINSCSRPTQIDFGYQRNEGGGSVMINQRYKYNNDDLLLGIRDLDDSAKEIIYNPVIYREIGQYDVAYRSYDDKSYQVRIIVAEMDSRIHLQIKSPTSPLKIYLRWQCQFNLNDVLDLMLIRQFKTLELNDNGYFGHVSGEGEFVIRMSIVEVDKTLNWVNLTIVGGRINNGNDWNQGLISWWLKTKKWVSKNLHIEI